MGRDRGVQPGHWQAGNSVTTLPHLCLKESAALITPTTAIYAIVWHPILLVRVQHDAELRYCPFTPLPRSRP
jgi:hypothetical protein